MIGENKDIIELIPEGLTKGTSMRKAQLVIFQEKNGERHLPFLITADDYKRLFKSFVLTDYSELASFEKLADLFDIRLMAVLFCRNEDNSGVHSKLYLAKALPDGAVEEHLMKEDITAGITAALMTGAPFYITRDDFESLYNKSGKAGQVAVPVSTMPYDLLIEALQQAVENDNFELASILRDEIRKRDEFSSSGDPS